VLHAGCINLRLAKHLPFEAPACVQTSTPKKLVLVGGRTGQLMGALMCILQHGGCVLPHTEGALTHQRRLTQAHRQQAACGLAQPCLCSRAHTAKKPWLLLARCWRGSTQPTALAVRLFRPVLSTPWPTRFVCPNALWPIARSAHRSKALGHVHGKRLSMDCPKISTQDQVGLKVQINPGAWRWAAS
jgi:hypothetical protein